MAVRALRGLVRGADGPDGVIEQDFGFRGILTANKLSKFRVSEPGGGAGGTIRAERARARRSGRGRALPGLGLRPGCGLAGSWLGPGFRIDPMGPTARLYWFNGPEHQDRIGSRSPRTRTGLTLGL